MDQFVQGMHAKEILGIFVLAICLIFFKRRDILATTLVRGTGHITYTFLPPYFKTNPSPLFPTTGRIKADEQPYKPVS
jgi:hypothetical protein